MKKTTGQLICLACALMFFYGFFLGGTQLVIVDIAAAFGVGTTGMGMLVSAQYAAAVIAPIAAGVLADRLGKKPLLIAFSAVFGIGCALIGLSPALIIYILGACLTGAVGALLCTGVLKSEKH
ncbi:MAG: MFS transporter [Ruminococcaceae bacterium]|nr:MFS transporter [Oscillospiraceae bacterium]